MPPKVRRITECEVCGNGAIIPALDLGGHPMCDDLVPIGDPRICKEYPIRILFCDRCRTAHQEFQVPKQELFPSSYHYRSRFTADVLNGMVGLVESCEKRFGSLTDRLVLDVGCNDGSLLDVFRGAGARTVGVEPTDAYRDAEGKGHHVIDGFLSEDIAERIVREYGAPDFVTFTNVFAHIEDLASVCAALRVLMSRDTVLVIENHYLGSVLDGNQFDTFYHEHPRTYSLTSFTHIAKTLGKESVDVEFPARYGGNIRVFLGNHERCAGDPELVETVSAREVQFADNFGELRANVERWAAVKGALIVGHVEDVGPLRAKAFPGRAAILVKLLGLDSQSIGAVYEKPGSLKVGHYLPGTRIPILDDDDLSGETDQSLPLLNLAWHIPREIREYMESRGYTGPIIDIVSPQDFA
jgi:methyltransferase family protein/putative zinc binding protein/C-methyltransferase-like protein